jgi:uncharacterized protein
MKICIIGGGASGMVAAYLLDKQGHQVTVFEKQPILGGHIRTLNQNVEPDRSNCKYFLEGGVLEFPVKFRNFIELMKELEIELEIVNIGSGVFLKDGRHFLSAKGIDKNFKGIERLREYLRLDTLYARSVELWVKFHLANVPNLYNKPLSKYLSPECIRNYWVKLLIMYSYSMSFKLIDNFPAELAIPILRDYIFTDWVRIKGGVYSYIEKILKRFRGEVLLNAEIAKVVRNPDSVEIKLSDSQTRRFDKVVFATSPDQVMQLLFDPTDEEIKRFSAWKTNLTKTVMHTDTSMYAKYGIKQFSEFDFFQTDKGWGYNAYLNQLCGIPPSVKYSLAFNLDSLIAKDKIIHIQEHHTPLYTVDSFRYRDEVVSTNGENNTYHAGAYLGNGLHEGAITSAIRVAQAIG